MDMNEVLSWMDPATRERYEHALFTGGDTFENFGAPDCGCDGLLHPYYCDDCEKWHDMYTGTCFDVIDGELWVFDWTCDEDGDWDYNARCPVGELEDDHYERALNEALAAEAERDGADEEQ